ncbi:hypothetical protein C8T65DRAFT_666249 [Cerioporus squamosus]|nr:hypothetical protein C8T65DRAFT_666249 [Cerioporus squamosus]
MHMKWDVAVVGWCSLFTGIAISPRVAPAEWSPCAYGGSDAERGAQEARSVSYGSNASIEAGVTLAAASGRVGRCAAGRRGQLTCEW